MESIYVLALAKSHRTSNDKELIRWGQENAKIEGGVKEYLAEAFAYYYIGGCEVIVELFAGVGGVLFLYASLEKG